MKTRPVDIKPFKELGNPAFAIDTPRDHISLGSLVLCVAKKQSGNAWWRKESPKTQCCRAP